jgi:hypothetical protein
MNNHKIEHEVKLNAIIDRLASGGYEIQYPCGHPEERHTIQWHTLKILIIEAIQESNRHTLSKWRNELLALKIIEPNPTSQLSEKKRVFLPHDWSRYYINKDKLDRHTLSNSASSEHQKAIKNTFSLKQSP